MSIQALLVLALQASIFLAVLGVGMRVVPGDLAYLLRTPSRLVRSLLAMNVLAPIVAIAVCKTFSLVMEPGPVEVSVGSSSSDLRSSATFNVTGKARTIKDEERAFLSEATVR